MSLLLTAQTPADITFPQAGLTVRVPRGFVRQPAHDPAPSLLGTWRRDAASPRTVAPVVLQFVHLRAEVPQGPLSPAALDELRVSDPFAFTDHRERAHTLGFEVDALVGRATLHGHRVLRLVAPVPLDRDSVAVVVVAPEVREAEARIVFRDVLASARGATSWSTPQQRARATALRSAAVLAMILALAYAVGAMTLWRRRDVHRRARVRVMAAIAGLWLLVAVLLPWGAWCALVQALALFASFAWHARKLTRGAFSDAYGESPRVPVLVGSRPHDHGDDPGDRAQPHGQVPGD